jgi:hypothetical protein
MITNDNKSLYIQFELILAISDVVNYDPMSTVIATKNHVFYCINGDSISNITNNGDSFRVRSHHNNKERFNCDHDNNIVKYT